MLTDIGRVAGRVWVILGEKGEINISRLPKILKIKTHTAYQAVGWLAREGKIREEEKDGKTFVSLTREEINSFKNLF
jgi:Mn-dependent DtxR family transcriptional regulator